MNTDPALLSSINTSTGFGTAPTNTTDPYLLGATNTSVAPTATPTTTANLYGGYGSAAAQQQAAANAAAQSAGLSRLDNQSAIGHQNILDQYTSAFQNLQNGRTNALGQYDTQRTNTTQGNINARAGIQDNVHGQISGLQRLLGAHGAGNSSAASILAPYAAAQYGNQQTANVNNTYGQNLASIDQNQNNYNTNYDNSVGQLGAQRDNQNNQLDQSILGTRAQLTNAPAGADIYNQIDNLGKNVTYTPKAVAYTDPNLAAYNYSQAGKAQVSPSNGALGASTGAFYNLLNPQDKQKQLTGAA